MITKKYSITNDDITLTFDNLHKGSVYDINMNLICKIGIGYSNIDPDSYSIKKNWENIAVYKHYECIYAAIFNYNTVWNIVTKDSINSSLLKDIMAANLDYGELCVENIYYFKIINDHCKKIIKYNTDRIFFVKAIDRKTYNEVNFSISTIDTQGREKFKSIDELFNLMKIISDRDEQIKKVTLRGYLLKFNNTWVKFETNIYKKLKSIMPTITDNEYASYLELYQKNDLVLYGQYFIKNSYAVVNVINIGLKSFSRELFSLYYLTRSKQNSKLYDSLTSDYKQVIFNIHGIYIKNKSIDQNKKVNINYYIVYSYLKQLNPTDLAKLLVSRRNNYNELFMVDCGFLEKLCTYLEYGYDSNSI